MVNSGFYCSLLEVADKSRSTTSVTELLQELEVKRVVSLVWLEVQSRNTAALRTSSEVHTGKTRVNEIATASFLPHLHR